LNKFIRSEAIDYITSQFPVREASNFDDELAIAREDQGKNPTFRDEILVGFEDEVDDLLRIIREHLLISQKEYTSVPSLQILT
jgi:hypothetical protein